MTDKRTTTFSIRRPSKTPAVFLVASFTDPAWAPVELNGKDSVTDADKEEDAEYEFAGDFEVPEGKHYYHFQLGADGPLVCNEGVDTAVDDTDGVTKNVHVVKSAEPPSSNDDKTSEAAVVESLPTETTEKDAGDASGSTETDDGAARDTSGAEEEHARPTSDAPAETAEESKEQPNEQAKEELEPPLEESTEKSKEEPEEEPKQDSEEEPKEESEAEPKEELKDEGATQDVVTSEPPTAMTDDSQNHKVEDATTINGNLKQESHVHEPAKPTNDNVDRDLKTTDLEEESNPWNPASLPESPVEKTDKDDVVEPQPKDEPTQNAETLEEIAPAQQEKSKESVELESNPWNPASLPESPAEPATENELAEVSKPEVEKDDKPAANTQTEMAKDSNSYDSPASNDKLDMKEAAEFNEENQKEPGHENTAENAEQDTSDAPETPSKEESETSATVVNVSKAEKNPALEVSPENATTNEASKVPDPETESTGDTSTATAAAAATATAAVAAVASSEDINEKPEPETTQKESAATEEVEDDKATENKAIEATPSASVDKGSDDVIPETAQAPAEEQQSAEDKVEHGPPEPNPNDKDDQVPEPPLGDEKANDTNAEAAIASDDSKHKESQEKVEASSDLLHQDSSPTDGPAPKEVVTDTPALQSEVKDSANDAPAPGAGLDGQDVPVPPSQDITKDDTPDQSKAVANEQLEQSESSPVEVGEQSKTEHVDESTSSPNHVSDKQEEGLASAADDHQQTESASEPAEAAEHGALDTSEVKEPPAESKENIPVEPVPEVKEEDASTEETSALLNEAEQETKSAAEGIPQPIAQTTAASEQYHSNHTNGSTTVAPSQVAAPVVEAAKPGESPIAAGPNDKDSSKEPSAPQPAEAKKLEEPVPQQPEPVETETTATTTIPKPPEIVISQDSSDEPAVPAANDTDQEPQRSTTGAEEQSPSSPAASPNLDVVTQDASGAEGSRPATASKSLSSLQIHKKQGFFKALWRAVFVNFFGGLFAPFRRRRNRE